MILEENRTASYIRSLYTGNTELLDTIEQEALRDYVPIIRVETQSLLKLLLKQKKPRRQYIHYFPELMRLLEQDGYLVSDNVLQDGDLIQSRFAVERRNRTIHARMREYLYELTHNQELTTSILPVGDGVAVSVKDRKEEQL